MDAVVPVADAEKKNLPSAFAVQAIRVVNVPVVVAVSGANAPAQTLMPPEDMLLTVKVTS